MRDYRLIGGEQLAGAMVGEASEVRADGQLAVTLVDLRSTGGRAVKPPACQADRPGTD